MTILVTGANGQLGNEMRIVSKGSKDQYIFTDVCDEHPESVEMLLQQNLTSPILMPFARW